MQFVDQVKVLVTAGGGGNGCVSFRREKGVPRGGPNGGDGGDGGDIVMVTSAKLTTLLDLQYQQHYTARSGGHGQGKDCHGRDGPDLEIRVPVGTVVMDEASGAVVADLVEAHQRVVVVRGGAGGRGNATFATPVRRAPRTAEPGRPGESRWLRLELKLLADVGLVGLPNAGKSTLISRISAARPKIADYPFTTLMPYLGVAQWGRDRSYVVADIPGLIQGAHEGRGLGAQFLRHIERTALLAHLVDCSEINPDEPPGQPVAAFEVIRAELDHYGHDLTTKPFVVVATKVDIRGTGRRVAELRRFCEGRGDPFIAISAATGAGIDELVTTLGQRLEALRLAQATAP